ncbi:undecaprenyl-phosphate galactose phosphotransferase WbaP [Megamonas funiformis]|uniref:undecaprenyl-phosphate galactose phosphotransferase WbaP n=1 Tax=Megamonas funiformis TaxID=437897 RepID=UPI001CC705C6|nr:undecaprenyl-phosphate galactose phosphotransferase WbaP [Megamonas funiformis]BDA10886.1 undecaprenyl-phosphate galactose phosphotransferase WbaP [Megamonas funiformis]
MLREKIYKMDYYSEKILVVLLLIFEYIAIIVAEKISLIIQNNIPYTAGKFYIPDIYFYLVIPAIYIFFVEHTKVNERFIFFWETMQRTFYAVLYSEIFCIIALYVFKSSNYLSRSYIVIFFVISFLSLYLFRQLLVKTCNKLNILKTPVIFVGNGKATEDIIYFTNHNNCFGIKVADIVEEIEDINQLRKNIISRIEQLKVKTIIIAIPNLEKNKLLDLVEDIQPLVRNLMFVPNTIGIPVINLEVKKLYESNMLLLSIRNNLAKKTNRRIKRIFDIVFSLLTMVIIIPVSIVVIVLIMIESPGAAPIFKHYRVGKGGILFPCYKFRSMVPNAQEKLQEYLKSDLEAQKEWNKYFKLKNDPRITKVGKFIRKTSIDELPQFINVLKGEMSWVGPRPIIKDEIHYYGKYIKDYYAVLPGITGMWQVSGRSEIGYKDRVSLDVWYVRNWSIWIDITLILKTIKTVLFRKGAY